MLVRGQSDQADRRIVRPLLALVRVLLDGFLLGVPLGLLRLRHLAYSPLQTLQFDRSSLN
jgi:hypothetical protein